MKEFVIEMPYIGGILSDNSYQFRRTKGTKPFVKFWKEELAEKVREQNIPVPSSYYYEVKVHGIFQSEVRPDISNLFKVIGDGLKKALPLDDKYYKFEDEGYDVKDGEPKIIIKIIPLEEEIKNGTSNGKD